ncbi:branched-chain amino acid ABC transporter permease [Bradyrhizobium canariense]|uniref:Branched-chain amino acid transport system permease protein n=1 Tax=Bradyrhizobium canariense TaxID=255045 RepID=A0A1H2BDH3_9BRAD|nr:branched-chain amino acid ABC transporter permease [Bradyrhizobium canariense]SDT56228.1 branched-chain amino acid transport system permease protein [Bradyrhizobium canariense]
MLAQQLANGLLLGGIYALVALAFSLTIGILNFLNFSIPALFMLGGVVSCAALSKGYGIAVSIVMALAVTGGVSLVIERFTFRWLNNSDSHIPLVSSLGFLILFENLVLIYFGSDAVGYPSPFGGASIRIASVLISLPQLASFAISLLLIATCYFVVTRTKLGRGLRSIAESSTVSAMLGVDVGRTVSGMYLISGLLAGMGGALFGISYLQVSWDMGSEVALKGISAMVLGGMGNIWGALLGALIIAIVEVLTISYVSSEAVNVVVYSVLLLLILVMPNGLLGDRAILVERM